MSKVRTLTFVFVFSFLARKNAYWAMCVERCTYAARLPAAKRLVLYAPFSADNTLPSTDRCYCFVSVSRECHKNTDHTLDVTPIDAVTTTTLLYCCTYDVYLNH